MCWCCFREVLAFQCYFHINKTHIIEFWRLQRLISKHIHCDRIACNVPFIRGMLVTNSDFTTVAYTVATNQFDSCHNVYTFIHLAERFLPI